MRFLLLVIALQSFCFVRAQSYIPIDTADRLLREASIEKYKKVDELYIAGIKEQYKGKEGKSLVFELQDYSDRFIEKIREGEFCYDERFIGKIEKILSELRAANEITFNDINILVSKDPSLNAYCLPNGTFIVNMGVFCWLENTDQVAALISHELAHEILNHPLKNILKGINEDLSKESRETLKSIKKLRYNKHEKALELFKRELYATGNARKKDEFEADSMGYLLLKNANFNYLDFIETLRLSEKYDSLTPKTVPIQTYREVFNLPNQKFREEWLKMEDFSGYDYSRYKERFDSDSLASHPETELRIRKLEELYPELRASRTNLPDSTFKVLARVAEYEQVPNFYYAEEYGLGIYLCLGRIWRGEDNTYYKEWLGKCFAKVYEARKNYRLNRYLDTINPKIQPIAYQQYLSFMWNLSLEEIGNIRDFYLPK